MKNQTAGILKFLVPFFLWVCLFRGFFLGSAIISQDTFTFYASVKFYLNNLAAGIYPLWDPSVLWGAPADLNLRPIGEFNPFLFLILILDAGGLTFYQAFVVYLALYYLLGMLGFYALAREIFKNTSLAYAGFVLLMFSSFGMTIFSAANMLLLFVPAVWFFYFLARMFSVRQRSDCLGLTFCLMIILTTYLPFYFLVIFLFSAILFSVFYFSKIRSFFQAIGPFIQTNRVTVAGCLAAVVIAAIVPFQTFLETSRGEILTPARHPVAEETPRAGMAMTYEEINNGGLVTRTSLGDLISGLDDVSYENDGFFYLPIICLIVLWISIFNVYSRRFACLLCLFLLLLLLSLAEVAPLHRALFTSVPFFRLFRNLYYFLPFLLAIGVLLSLEGLHLVIQNRYSVSSGKIRQALLVIVFGLVFLLLMRQPNVIWTSKATLGLCYIFCALLFAGKINPSHVIVSGGFMALAVLQPWQVLSGYNEDAGRYLASDIGRAVTLEKSKIQFSYIRPQQHHLDYEMILDANTPNYAFNFARLSMTDFPGFIPYRCGFPTVWAYSVFKNIDENMYRNYVKNKIILYDNIRVVSDGTSERDGLPRAFGLTDSAVAFMDNRFGDSDGGVFQEHNSTGKTPPQILTSDSGIFSVKKFTVNSLTAETNFDRPRFLVYNDSFHSDWKAYVNGKKTDIVRANGAFKGLWVPGGLSHLELRFEPAGGQAIYFFMLTFFFGCFIYVFSVFFQELKDHGTKVQRA